MSSKKFKDPIYGYIDIPNALIINIIDSPTFQRLRRIVQTSYAPLYSSAVHNRFVHSLGVYHLGRIAGEKLTDEVKRKVFPAGGEENGIKMDRILFLFTIACLLHDVGHAPFSHTGEYFYLEQNNGRKVIHQKLKEFVDNDSFSKDVPNEESKSAAPHEIMSAIIGLKEFDAEFQNSEEKSFFARCITGYKYTNRTTENSIKNCYIGLLNSKVIDVDKLDYLIRDSYITGYDTVKIDYYRLLSAITIVPVDKAGELDEDRDSENQEEVNYELAYFKGAFSVIENVIFAHDSERKWIQSHPVILYESYILRHVMNMLAEELDAPGAKLFSMESLSVEGQFLNSGECIRLLSDDDIIFLMKKYYEKNKLVEEYFDRRCRRHPVWKSEAEYKVLFLDKAAKGEIINDLESALWNTAEYLFKSADSWAIDKSLVSALEGDLKEIDVNPKLSQDIKTQRTQRKHKELVLKISKTLIQYADSVGYSGDFILLKESQFNSGFLKPDFSKTKIVFPSGNNDKVVYFEEKISSYAGRDTNRDNFFYLFYDRNAKNGEKIDISQLSKILIRAFV